MTHFEYMCKMTGYQPFTTFNDDFDIAEIQGKEAILDTFNRAMHEWKDNYKYLTELVMVTNWKIWEWHYRGEEGEPGADIYEDTYYTCWETADGYACNHLKGDELSYFFRTTD